MLRFSPTQEQERALELFQTGGSLRIDAYAGSGKTSTLELLAESSKQRGCYIAFNKSIAEQAQQRFPSRVRCSTSHSLAFRTVIEQYGFTSEKMTGQANANRIAHLLGLEGSAPIKFADGFTMTGRGYAAVLHDACRRFLQSADAMPEAKHFSRSGKLAKLNAAEFQTLAANSVAKVLTIWKEMQNPKGDLPLGHDGYLKLWALSEPKLPGDYILLDEAQDSNAVVLGVLARQKAQVVYVGDPYQQIYEWRGAVNAMASMRTEHRTPLTQSFRFGANIASAASNVIARLGAKEPLRGSAKVQSEIGEVYPNTVLCRTNAGAISQLIKHLEEGAKCHVIGGTAELERMLGDVQRLKRGTASDNPDLFGFGHWDEVVEFCEESDGGFLKGLVKLVGRHGEGKLMEMLKRGQADESSAQVRVSTAHKAKGREWDYVLLDSDFDVEFIRALSKKDDENEDAKARQQNLDAEMRLLYVAMTRAKRGVQLPTAAMKYFKIENTKEGMVNSPVFISKTAREASRPVVARVEGRAVPKPAAKKFAKSAAAKSPAKTSGGGGWREAAQRSSSSERPARSNGSAQSNGYKSSGYSTGSSKASAKSGGRSAAPAQNGTFRFSGNSSVSKSAAPSASTAAAAPRLAPRAGKPSAVLAAQDRVRHPLYGTGTVLRVDASTDERHGQRLTVHFDNGRSCVLAGAFAGLERV